MLSKLRKIQGVRGVRTIGHLIEVTHVSGLRFAILRDGPLYNSPQGDKEFLMDEAALISYMRELVTHATSYADAHRNTPPNQFVPPLSEKALFQSWRAHREHTWTVDFRS